MIYVEFTLLFFCFTCVVQLMIHRILMIIGKRTFATVHVLTVGCMINATVIYFLYRSLSPISQNGSLWFYPIPVSASVLYILLYFAYIIYSVSPYLGQEGPTSRILMLFRKHQKLTEQQLIAAFTDKEIIFDRIDDLVRSKCVTKRGTYILLSPVGSIIARGILKYRTVLGIQRGG